MLKTHLPVKLLLLLTCLPVSVVFAQKEYNIWYFSGVRNGLDFNTTPPTAISAPDSSPGPTTGNSGICNASGNLLFYTNGAKVWNRLHQEIITLHIHGRRSYSLKMPGQDSIYTVILAPTQISPSSNYLEYIKIDMRLNNGLGEVISGGQVLMKPNTPELAMTVHANKRDFWITAMQFPELEIYSFLLTPGGVDTSQKILSAKITGQLDFSWPQFKYSPDGNILTGPVLDTGFLSLYHFDNSTGLLSDKLDLQVAIGYKYPFSFEFSPDSRYLYVYENFTRSLSQYDLRNWNLDSIKKSRIIIDPNREWYDLQLGPDGKIYAGNIPLLKDSVLSVIHYPNRKDLACELDLHAIKLQRRFRPAENFIRFPTILMAPPYLDLGGDKESCAGDSILISPHTAVGKYFWNTGDTSKNLWVKQGGSYRFTLYTPYDTLSDTVEVVFHPKPQVELGADTILCAGGNFSLTTPDKGYSYLWNTGDTGNSISVKSSDIYILQATSLEGCTNIDSISVRFASTPTVYIGNDSTFCGLVNHTLTPQSNGKFHLWNTGDTTKELYVNKDGTYSLRVHSEDMCENADTIRLDKLDFPYGIKGDTVICGEDALLDAGNPGSTYLWSGGETSRYLLVKHSGVYSVTVSNGPCSITDTIVVAITPAEDCVPYLYIPNSFTPNGDGLNDVFEVKAANLHSLELIIYDRWGGCIFTSTNPNTGWDGTYKGEPVPTGVYMYRLSYRHLSGNQKRENTKGLVHLVR